MKKIHQIFPLPLPSHKKAAQKAGVSMKGTRGECVLRIALRSREKKNRKNYTSSKLFLMERNAKN